MQPHSKFSGSRAGIWVRCHGAVNLCAAVPPEPENEHMRAGTAAHEQAASLLSGYPVPDEVSDAVRYYVDYVRANSHGGLPIEVEQRLGGDLAGGTPDAVFVEHDTHTVKIYDYKNGVKPVDDWWQLVFYLWLRTREYALYADWTYELHYVQPNRLDGVKLSVQKGLMREIYTRDFAQIVDAIRQGSKPDAPRTAGSHCEYCPGRAYCPEHRDRTTARVQDWFNDDAPAPLSPGEELTELHRLRALLNERIDAVYTACLHDAERGDVPSGWKLVDSLSNRYITHVDEFIAVALQMGMDQEDVCNPAQLKSPAQLEKVMSPRIVKTFSGRENKGHKLVPLGDQRPAVSSKATQWFISEE